MDPGDRPVGLASLQPDLWPEKPKGQAPGSCPSGRAFRSWVLLQAWTARVSQVRGRCFKPKVRPYPARQAHPEQGSSF